MKLVLVLMLCAVAAAAPSQEEPKHLELNALTDTDDRNLGQQIVNNLINQMLRYIRRVINEGSDLFGIPPLDPLELDHFHLYVPAGLINLDLELKNVYATGIGGFVSHRCHLDLRDLSMDIDMSVPIFDFSAGHYDLLGDLFTAIPLYGKGHALFKMKDFRFKAKVFLVQSENEISVLIDRIENAAFEIRYFKSDISGVIGGGDIDAVVNAVIDEVVIDYVNRFRGAIATGVANRLPELLNPILNELDTWKYIAALPKPRP